MAIDRSVFDDVGKSKSTPKKSAIDRSVFSEQETSAPKLHPASFSDVGVSHFGSLKDFAGNMGSFVKGIADPFIGGAKELANQALNVGALGAKGAEAITGKLGAKPFPNELDLSRAHAALAPSNLPQKVGAGVTNVLEFLSPAGEVAKGAKFIDTLLQGSGLLKAAARVGGKAALEGAATAPIAIAQSGDVKKGLGGGAVATGLSLLSGGVGQAARSAGIPEALYQKFFRSTADEAMGSLKASVQSEFKKTNPQEYKQLLDAGFIREVSGKPVLDEKLAKRALDAGLRGSTQEMAKTVIRNNLQNEVAARAAAAAVKKPLTLEPNFRNTLELVAATYKDAGLGQVSDEASALAKKIGKDGKVSATDALDVRRFLDKMRTRGSFDSNSPLPLKQENLKELTDALRARLNALPGMGEIMKSYSNNIEFADALARQLAKEGNGKIANALDAAIFGGGLILNHPGAAAAAAFGQKTLNNARALTGVAQSLNKSVPSLGEIAARGAVGAVGSNALLRENP